MPRIRQAAEKMLTENILPFWKRMRDDKHGGFYGYMDFDLNLDTQAEKGCILNSRILWFFSEAAMLTKRADLAEDARHAYQFFTEHCYDVKNGGVYWSCDYTGKPLDTTKHTYNQGFAIYALSAYYRLTGEQAALNRAKEIFHLIEQQHGRSCGEGPQQRHPSKLAARELSRRVIERHAIEHRQGKHLVQHVVIGLRRAGIHLQRPGKQQVVPHRAGHQRRSLRHQAHAPAPFHRLEPINGNTLERQRAARARQHERARVQQSGLSRSGRPREVVQAARLQRETHIRKGRERLPVATKLHPDMSCLE